MPSDTLTAAVFGLLAFTFALVALGAKLPLEGLLRFLEANSREGAVLVVLALFLVFLLKLFGLL